MAITYIQTPKEWSPINNDLIYYVKTNTVGLSNVYLEVYVSGNFVSRVKLVLNADKSAYCDIRPFLNSFIQNNQIYFEDVLQKNLTDGSYFTNYQVKVKETLAGATTDDTLRYAFNGQVPFIDYVEYTGTEYLTGGVSSKFLTYSPRVLKTDFIKTNFLSYINGVDKATKIRIFTHESGAILPTNVYEKDVNDLSAKASIIAISEQTLDFEFLTWENVNENWEDLSDSTWEGVGEGVINPNVTRLDVVLINDAGDDVSETFTFLYDDFCSKYQKTNIYWQNSLGGFDSYTFNLVKKVNYQLQRQSITSFPYTFDNDGYSAANGNVFNLGTQNYMTNYSEGWVLNSGLLTDEEHRWMWELIKSHFIYVERTINGVAYYVPATLKATSYEPKTKLVDGLTNVQIELEFNYDNIKITK